MSDEPTVFSFTIKLVAGVKHFANQKLEQVINSSQPWEVTCSDVKAFSEALWPKVQPWLKREIIFIDNKPYWSAKECPTEDDLDRFLTFFDTRSRRSFKLASLTMSELLRWNDGRDISLNICEYSTAVSTKSCWLVVEKELLKFAGVSEVVAQNEWQEIEEELKEVHQDKLKAACWKQWAEYISKQEPRMRKNLIKEPPPEGLIHLFTKTEPNRLLKTRCGAHSDAQVKEALALEVTDLRQSFNPIRKLVLELNAAVDTFEQRLCALEKKCSVYLDPLDFIDESIKQEIVEMELDPKLYCEASQSHDEDDPK